MRSQTGVVHARNHLVWVGLLITAFGLISYFTTFARFPSLRDVPWLNLSLVTLGLALSVAALVKRRNVWSILGLTFGIAFAGLLVWYVFVLSFSLPGSETAVAVGSHAPPLDLVNHEGQTVDLGHLLGRKVLVVFYRGFW